MTAIGCRITHCDRVNQNPPLAVRRRQMDSLSTRWPSTVNSAGSRVRAISIENSMTVMPPTPRDRIIIMSKNSSPDSAITDVPAENTIALPEVSIVVTTADATLSAR